MLFETFKSVTEPKSMAIEIEEEDCSEFVELDDRTEEELRTTLLEDLSSSSEPGSTEFEHEIIAPIKHKDIIRNPF
jgi:hypothetical protein